MTDFRIDLIPYIATADGQLHNLVYELIRFSGRKIGDHAHCELCWMTISEDAKSDDETEGYYCRETGCWLCKKCFIDFSPVYNWKVDKIDINS